MFTKLIGMNEEVINDNQEKVKIVFLGNPSVGKTSILNRWVSGSYNPRPSPTVSSAHIMKEVNYGNKKLRVIVCDTAGEERYQSLCGNFVHGADCVICVCSYDDNKSFDSLYRWYRLVSEECDTETRIIVAVNKRDLVTELNETFPYGKTHVFHVSAKTGEEISNLFQDAIDQAVQCRIECATKPKGTEINAVKRTEGNSCC